MTAGLADVVAPEERKMKLSGFIFVHNCIFLIFGSCFVGYYQRCLEDKKH